MRALLLEGYKQLPAEEREELEDIAAADQERYEDEVAAWQAAHAKRRAQGKRARDE